MAGSERNSSLWTVRLLGVVLSVNLVGLAAVIVALVSLFPLKSVRPFAVNFADKSDVVATIEPIGEDAGSDMLMQSLAKEYVIMRHSIVSSPKEMERRWGKPDGMMYLMSTPDVYLEFQREVIKVVQAIQSSQTGATVSVDVKSVSTIKSGQTYQVEFTLESRDRNGRLLLSKNFVSTLDVELEAVPTALKNKLLNPTGFTVVGYRMVEKTS